VCRQFGPQLDRLGHRVDHPAVAAAADSLIDALVVSCDVYAWKLLRRDMGRDREHAETVIRQTVRALLMYRSHA
jgi:hypothetical protein